MWRVEQNMTENSVFYKCMNEGCTNICNMILSGEEVITFNVSFNLPHKNEWWMRGSKDQDSFVLDRSTDYGFDVIYKGPFIPLFSNTIKEELNTILNRVLKLKSFI
jgi:hypothetical protein